MLIGCIRCHGPLDRNRNCPICDGEKMKDDHDDLKDKSRTPFNQLPEDEQVQRMERASPRHAIKQPVQLVPTISDAEYAEDLKNKLVATIEPVLDLVTKANKDGFEVQFGIGKNPLGKQVITALKVMREY